MSGTGETSSETQTKERTVNTTATPVTDHERELSQNAASEFSKGDFAACWQSLNKLELLRPQDLKVTHNKVVVEYYKSTDSKRTEFLRKSLNAICDQSPTTSPSDAEDVEKCVIRYNQAVILYHTKQYEGALQIVNRLFALVEPMEESFVHKVCLLLIELHLVTNRPDTALALVNYIESQFTSTGESSKSTLSEQNQKQDSLMKSRQAADKEQKKDSIDAATEAFKIKLLKYKARIYLMTRQLKHCKREWKTLVSLGMPMNLSTVFLKANLEYLRENYKKAMKLLNSVTSDDCPDFKSCGESIAVLYYNNMATLHFAMGKPNLACFYIRKALEENQKAVDSVRPKNANNTTDSSSQTPPALHTLGGNRHYELMYSLGVSLLHAGQATKAFDCLTEAAQRLHNNPRVWLRMAECCIYCHKPSNKVDFDLSKRRKDLVETVIGDSGNGIHKKIILATSLTKNCKYYPDGMSYAIPQPTLEFGMLCLRNAHFLLPAANSEESTLPTANLPSSGSRTVGAHQQSSNLLGSLTGNSNNRNSQTPVVSQATAIEALNLKISILAASAYVALCLGDYVMALEYAKSLLAVNKLPGAHWLLGNLYAAESLIFLDKINEAIEYLKPDGLRDTHTFIPIVEAGVDRQEKIEDDSVFKSTKAPWCPSNVATGKALLRYNLAVAYAIRGELDKSGETLKQVWMSKGPDCEVPIHVIMLALYIELQLGHVDIARSIIKQHYCAPQQN